MTKLTEAQRNKIRRLIRGGASRSGISLLTGIPEGTISHYQNPKSSVNQNQTSKMMHKRMAEIIEAQNIKRKKLFKFTEEEINTHDESVREGAYRKAAVATVNKLSVLSNFPIYKALKELEKYTEYLIKEYNLK